MISEATHQVVNLVVVESEAEVFPGHYFKQLPERSPVTVGWSYDGTQFLAPAEERRRAELERQAIEEEAYDFGAPNV
jgi:hypothetical protein